MQSYTSLQQQVIRAVDSCSDEALLYQVLALLRSGATNGSLSPNGNGSLNGSAGTSMGESSAMSREEFLKRLRGGA